MANVSSAAEVMHDYITPVVKTLCVLASLACVFFLVNGGINYMSSSGKPEKLEHAKRVIKHAILGLIIVLGAGVLTAILSHAFGNSNSEAAANLPSLTAIPPAPVSNGLVEVLIKAITGLLNNIIQSVAAPFLDALSFFTTQTPLMHENSAVFNLWLAIVGITDALFIFVVALLGFQVMSFSTFGFDDVDFKHLLPRLALVFMLINTSIFTIDAIIEISNAMIRALNAAGGSSGSVWEVLSGVVEQSGGQGVAALLIMVTFVIFSVILLVYYVGRLVTLYIGAVLAPIVLLIWLLPGFRDFSESAIKTYFTTIFVLFVHVVILLLAASLFVGMSAGSGGQAPDVLMSMVVGLATVLVLLKTQGVMTQFSYVSMGARNTRKLGKEFISGVSYLGGKSKAVVTTVAGRGSGTPTTGSGNGGGKNPNTNTIAPYKQPKSNTNTNTKPKPKDRVATGTTTTAPKVKPREPESGKVSKPMKTLPETQEKP